MKHKNILIYWAWCGLKYELFDGFLRLKIYKAIKWELRPLTRICRGRQKKCVGERGIFALIIDPPLIYPNIFANFPIILFKYCQFFHKFSLKTSIENFFHCNFFFFYSSMREVGEKNFLLHFSPLLTLKLHNKMANFD